MNKNITDTAGSSQEKPFIIKESVEAETPEYYGYASAGERFVSQIINSVTTGIPYLGFLILIAHWIVYLSMGKGIGYLAMSLVAINKDTGVKQSAGRLFLRAMVKNLIPAVLSTVGFTLLLIGLAQGSMSQALIGAALLIAVFFVWVYYLIAISKSKTSQSPYDKITNTLVVKEKPGSISGVAVVAIVIASFVIMLLIIGILSSVVLTSLGGARQAAQDANDIATLSQLQLALTIKQDADGKYPSAENLAMLKSNNDLFLFSGDSNSIEWFDNTEDSSRYCAYVELVDSASGDYYVIDDEGARYLDTRPLTIEDC